VFLIWADKVDLIQLLLTIHEKSQETHQMVGVETATVELHSVLAVCYIGAEVVFNALLSVAWAGFPLFLNLQKWREFELLFEEKISRF
jgi:hypothetical protein